MRVARRLGIAAATVALASTALPGIASASAKRDFDPPTIAVNPTLKYVTGSQLSDNSKSPRVSAIVSWTATDDDGVCSQSVRVQSNDGNRYYYPARSARSQRITVRAGSYADVTVDVADCAGNADNSYAYFYPSLYQETSATFTQGWTTSRANDYSNLTAIKARKAKASATFKFSGQSVGVVSLNAPTEGSFDLYVDGVLKSTVRLNKPRLNRLVVASHQFKASGTHTVKIVTKTAAQVDIDGFLIS